MFSFTWWEYPTELVWWQLALYYCAVSWGAFVIGCFGVGGGVIFMPLLLLMPGMTPSIAAGSIYWGCTPMVCLRNVQLMYYGQYNLVQALPLMCGALVGALLGQAALPHLPREAVALLVATLAIWAGFQTHRRVTKERRAKAEEAKASQAKLEANPEEAPEHQGHVVDGAVSLGEIELDVKVDPRSPPAPGCLAYLMPCLFPQPLPSHLWPKAEAKGSQPAPWKLPPIPALPKAARVEGDGAGTPTTSERSPIFSLDRETSTVMESRLQALFKMLLGLVASFLSSISATGGPLILFPIGLMLDPQVKMKNLVALSVPFSLVMVDTSAVGAMLFGQVDLGFALAFSVVGTISALVGGVMMQRMGDSKLKAGVGAVLVLVGLAVLVRTGMKLFA